MSVLTYEDKFYGECKEDGLEGEDDAGEQCFVFMFRLHKLSPRDAAVLIMVIIKTTMTTTILRMIAIELISNHI